MVVPDSANAMPHSFQVSRWMFQAAAGAALGTVALTAVLWTHSLRASTEAHRAEVERLEAQLHADRVALQTERDSAQSDLNRVRAAMEPLLETENKMRAIAGLQPRYRDVDAPSGGQGGRGDLHELDETAAMIDPADLDLAPAPDWTAASVEQLLAEFGQLGVSYDGIGTALHKESDRLDSTPLIIPVEHPDAWISSGYGYRVDPFKQTRRFHEGIDIVAPRGTPVIAPANGTVTFAGWKAGLGKLVVIKHGFGFETEYAHNDRLAVKKGDTVVRGQTISYLGSTGRSTGPHLHYEVRKGGKLVNPYRYIID